MPARLHTVTETFCVAPQLSVADIGEAARAGYTLIVNNRPDGEMLGQPKSADIAKAAEEAGIAYIHLPVDANGITPNHLGGLENAISDARPGKTLGFCKSGMRSILVWAYAQARSGEPVETIIAEAREAGFDIAGHEPALVMLHDGHKSSRTDPPL